ncbi:MAG: LamG domain-containing protein [Thermoanaerobaculia bacterium]|nr:LamG domain-containing protein [Thermoanaerobaculia bacterium]
MARFADRTLCGAALASAAVLVAAGSAPRAAAAESSARGLLVWESNRSGDYRIWTSDLGGRGARQLTADEAGRDHCCARISPDGERVAYLSMPVSRRRYLPPTATGELRLLRLDGGERLLSATARHVGAHRAVVWWSPTELAYLEADGTTRALDLALGASRVVARGAAAEPGWLVAPGGGHATTNEPTFGEVDPATGRVRLATPLGGCEPTYSADGELGLWVAGAGGPLDVVDLATRATRSLVRKSDPRLPEGWRYLYFPALSPDRTQLAWAASNGEHDHFRADYDVFVAPLDPATLELAGPPLHVAPHPGVDRFPDVWRLAPPRPPGTRPAATRVAAAAPAAAPPVLLWNLAADANRRTPDADSERLAGRGAVWSDRLGRLALAGGLYEAGAASVERVAAALRGTNSLSLALLLEPATVAASARGPLVALTRSPRDRGFVLRQSGDRLELLLRTGRAGAAEPAIPLFALADTAPRHLALAFSPGRLAIWRDGELVERRVVAGDFYHWRLGALQLGAEAGDGARFRGYLSHLRVWGREIDDAEAAAAARSARAVLAAPVERLDVAARLLARSRPPTLDEISPYRQALLVEEYELVRGGGVPRRFRVARWALLDARPTAPLAIAVGATVALRLEPFAAQPQLEAVVLADTLPAASLPLYFAAGLDDG